MPWIPFDLADILDNPAFTSLPSPSPIAHLIHHRSTSTDTEIGIDTCAALAKSIIYQTTLALAHLHTRSPPIAHRDIKPRNILLTHTGCVKLIDFGIAYEERISAGTEKGAGEILWPEVSGKMYNDVATG